MFYKVFGIRYEFCSLKMIEQEINTINLIQNFDIDKAPNWNGIGFSKLYQ